MVAKTVYFISAPHVRTA